MDTLVQDLRYAVRSLGKSRAFTAMAVVCLALGIGANATIFSVVNASLLRPFPFDAPERLVHVTESRPASGVVNASPSWAAYRAWRDGARGFSQLAAYDWRSLTIADGDEPVRLAGSAVTWNLFPMLGVAPAVGRGFREDEDRAGAAPVVLLSHALWTTRYGADPRIVGRVIRVNDVQRTVVGVMPERFAFPETQSLWIPMAPLYDALPLNFMDRGIDIMGRLAPGVTIAAASAEVAAIQRRLALEHALAFNGWRAGAVDIAEEFLPAATRTVILIMMGAVTFVLLIACANVANLLLARATTRHREIAVRTALGASRWRIVRQLLTESVIIGLLAGALGVLLAFWGLDLIDATIPPQEALPYYIHWAVDGPTLAYTLAISVGTGLLFGLAPALQAVKPNLQEALKEGTRGSGTGAARSRLRATLVVAEIGLSLVLLVGASLFVRSFFNLHRTSGGFDTAPLMTMRFYLPATRYPDDSARVARTEDVVRRVEALPGVEAAAASNLIPLGGGGDEEEIVIAGRDVPLTDAPRMYYAGVTANFFRTLGVPIVRGRDFTAQEAATRSGVAIVDERMATRLFQGADPIGQRFRYARDTAGRDWFTIIGVVRQFSYEQLDDLDEARPAAYLPLPYQAYPNTGLTVRVRRGDPAAITRVVRGQIHTADPTVAVFEAASMEEVRRAGYWQYGLFGGMFTVFGGIALVLATIGVYGVVSYGVAQRTHEIGVRVALGARRADVLRLVVGHGVRLAAFGVLFGLIGAALVTRVIGSLLVDVSATDPLSFAGVALFLTAVAAVASLVPARRAIGVDPVNALRSE